MVELLKRQYNLLALKIRLDMSAPEIQVICDLEVGDKGEQTSVESWSYSAKEMGIPHKLDRRQSLYQGYEFHLPDYFGEELKEALQREGDLDEPLWLHLVKPCGYLAMVPWEQLLQPSLDRPLLRLPEFLTQPPRESPPWLLEVALCGSMPEAKPSFELREHLHKITHHILNVVPQRKITIHIFTDNIIAGEVRGALEGDFGSQVKVHNPAEAEPYAAPEATTRISDSLGRLDNPWLLWMRDALKGRRVDVVHFITHGYLSRDKGALALAESPLQNTDPSMARFVGTPELMTFLTHMGAWSAAFTSVERNYSEMALRLLADTIAQRRPGPVLHHELRLDSGCEAMAEAYRFLFDDGQPPRSPALFIYNHPSRLLPRPEDTRSLSKGIDELSEGEAQVTYWENESTPPWVAATKRYIEQSRLDILKMERGTDEFSEAISFSTQQDDIDNLENTLQQIQDIVAKAANDLEAGGE